MVLSIEHLLVSRAVRFYPASWEPAQPSILSTAAHLFDPLLPHPTPLPRGGLKLGAEATRWHRSCVYVP
jgi:hypothetical protein